MAKILLLGEARGAKENLFDHGFVGSSGQELARMLAQVDLGPEPNKFASELEMISYWKRMKDEHNIIIANVFDIHPPDNKIETFFGSAKEGLRDIPPLRPGKFLLPDYHSHLLSLWAKIAAFEPNLIIALGNTACWATLGESKISSLRGTIKISPRLNVKVLSTYHPAAVLRQWNLRPIVLADLEKAKKEGNDKSLRRIERYVTVEPTLEEIVSWLERDAGYYAVDIETVFRKQISMIGFARSPADAMVIPFVDLERPGGNYWAKIEDEIEAWKLADRALKRPIPKVFQNGVFDLSHLLTTGFRPLQCYDDSMLLHHALYPEMLKSLGFLGSVYSEEIAWKTMRTKGNNLKRDE